MQKTQQEQLKSDIDEVVKGFIWKLENLRKKPQGCELIASIHNAVDKNLRGELL